MTIERKTNHVEEAVAQLPAQFRGSVSLAALLGSYVAQIQELENAAWGVYDAQFIDRASGEQLDVIGREVGQAREGRDDPTYRLYLKVRVMLNRGSGTRNEILRIFRALGFAAPELRSLPPASIVLDLGAVTDGLEAVYAAILAEARAAHIRAQLIYGTAPADELFCFSDDDTEQASVSQGWADDAQTTGGALADVLEA